MSRSDFKSAVPPLGHICAYREVHIFSTVQSGSIGGYVVAICNGEPGKRQQFKTSLEALRYAEGLAEGLGCEIRDHSNNPIT